MPVSKLGAASWRSNSTTAASMDQFLESIRQGISTHGQDYIRVIQGLDPADSANGIRWLQGIIDDIVTGAKKIISSLMTG